MEALANITIITDEIYLKNNNLVQGEFKINQKLKRRTGVLDDGKHYTELTIEIFNTAENPFPVDLRIQMTCVFESFNRPIENLDEYLKIQGTQILFPYLRTMVSNVTATAMMYPIILPLVDVKTLFPEGKQET